MDSAIIERFWETSERMLGHGPAGESIKKWSPLVYSNYWPLACEATALSQTGVTPALNYRGAPNLVY